MNLCFDINTCLCLYMFIVTFGLVERNSCFYLQFYSNINILYICTVYSPKHHNYVTLKEERKKRKRKRKKQTNKQTKKKKQKNKKTGRARMSNFKVQFRSKEFPRQELSIKKVVLYSRRYIWSKPDRVWNQRFWMTTQGSRETKYISIVLQYKWY